LVLTLPSSILLPTGFWGTGLFLEDQESSGSSVWKKIEKKKLLSSVEKSGLLSKAEGAGLTLSKIEKLGLLSTAEKLGLLTLAEDALSSDPGSIAALSMPCIVAAILSASLIPHDSSVTTFISYALALVSSGAAGVFFIGGFVISFLQEE